MNRVTIGIIGGKGKIFKLDGLVKNITAGARRKCPWGALQKVRFRRFRNPPQADQIPPLKSSGIKRHANFGIMRRTYRTLNDYEMQHNVPLN